MLDWELFYLLSAFPISKDFKALQSTSLPSPHPYPVCKEEGSWNRDQILESPYCCSSLRGCLPISKIDIKTCFCTRTWTNSIWLCPSTLFVRPQDLYPSSSLLLLEVSEESSPVDFLQDLQKIIANVENQISSNLREQHNYNSSVLKHITERLPTASHLPPIFSSDVVYCVHF